MTDYTDKPFVDADSLSAGDRFSYRGVDVTVVRDAEPWTEVTGLQISAIWCRREDDGREGFLPFGPGGVFK